MRAILVGAVESTRVAAHCLMESPDWTLAGLVTLPLAQAERHSDFRDLAGEARDAACPLLRYANANSPAAIEAMRIDPRMKAYFPKIIELATLDSIVGSAVLSETRW